MTASGRPAPTAPVCRACGSADLVLRGKKNGEFIRTEFSFHRCRACELLFVEPFSGFEIYNDAYYRGDKFIYEAQEEGIELSRSSGVVLPASLGSRAARKGAKAGVR